MENKKRPVAKMRRSTSGFSSWIFPEFLDQGAKFFKNHKSKNTPSILISFKTIKNLQKIQKSEFFMFFDDFRGR